jgi:protein TonB
MHICGPFIGSEPPCATAPVPDRVVWPAYTEQARAAEVEGYVDLSLVIDETGKPHDIQIIRSLGDGLDENAVAALQQWTFKPATYEGR